MITTTVYSSVLNHKCHYVKYLNVMHKNWQLAAMNSGSTMTVINFRTEIRRKKLVSQTAGLSKYLNNKLVDIIDFIYFTGFLI